MQSAVLVNPAAEIPRGSEPRLCPSSQPPRRPPNPRATVPAQPGCHGAPGLTRGQRQHGLSAFCSRCAEKTITPCLHAASLKIRAARPKEKAALVSGGCESSGVCLVHLFQDSRKSRQTCGALSLSPSFLETSPPFCGGGSEQAARGRLTHSLPGAPAPGRTSLPLWLTGTLGAHHHDPPQLHDPKLCHLLQEFDVPVVEAVVH